MKQTTALIALVILCAPVQAQVIPRQTPVDLSHLTIDDQFERPQPVSGHQGDVLVLIYGDRASADANKYLGEQVHIVFHPSARGQTPAQARQAPVVPVPGLPAGVRSPDVHLVPAASLGTVPIAMRGIIRVQFRNVSPDVPVWLDWKDVLKQQFGLMPGAPNVLVIDMQGRLRYTFAGTVDQDKFNQLSQAIEALRREVIKKDSQPQRHRDTEKTKTEKAERSKIVTTSRERQQTLAAGRNIVSVFSVLVFSVSLCLCG
jgi:hypothetical protein